MKLQAKDLTGIVKRIVLFVVPLVVLFLVLFSFYEKSLEQQASRLLQTEQEKGNAIIANQLEAVFSQFVSDLLLVFDSSEFSLYVQDTTDSTRRELEQLFLRIANKKSYINHIRLLDASGMEIIKVVHYPDTPATPSDTSSLKDRSGTDLFAFGKTHDAKTMFVSPIGLESRQSFDDGHKGPAMVFALPAYHEGSFFGLVIVDYDACFLLSFLRDYQATMTKNIVFGLAANDGYWIHRGGQNCSEFIYGEQDNASLFLEAPASQSLVFSDDAGLFVSEKRSYGYQAVQHSSTADFAWYPDEGRLWTVVSYYDLAELSPLSLNPVLQHPALKWWLAFVLLLSGSVVVLFLQLRRADLLQLEVSSLISEYSGNGIVVVDENSRITFCNHAFEVLCGYSGDELIGKDTHKFLPCANLPPKEKGLEQDVIPLGMPTWIRHRNGNEYLTNRTQTRAKTENRKDAYTVEVYTSSSWNVSEFVAYVREKEVEIPQMLLAGSEEKTTTSYCLLVHLNHHLERDSHYSLITESGFSLAISEFITTNLAQNEPVYAFSVDTYVVLMHEDDRGKVQPRIQSLLLGIEKECEALSTFVHTQAVCGYSQFSGSDASIPTLLVQASMATKMVEDSKKHRCLLFDEDVHNQYLRKQAILAAIPGAFSSSSLCLYYQAQVDVASGKIVGAEALIRWIHPELGFIAPDEFIPLMVEHHLISLLGEFVICEAVAFLVANKDLLGRTVPDFSLAINLSAEEFSHQTIIDLIGDELQREGVDPSMLAIELTEHTAVESLQNTEKLMDRLHQIGVGIAIDDFGTGFSSLSYLLELSIDKLKIDRSFIARYPDSDAITIYKTVLLLAKELGITVVAEGVETEEQLSFLKQIGCNQYQGYYFSKAVVCDEFLKQLEG